jgi:hypothetical protein
MFKVLILHTLQEFRKRNRFRFGPAVLSHTFSIIFFRVTRVAHLLSHSCLKPKEPARRLRFREANPHRTWVSPDPPVRDRAVVPRLVKSDRRFAPHDVPEGLEGSGKTLSRTKSCLSGDLSIALPKAVDSCKQTISTTRRAPSNRRFRLLNRDLVTVEAGAKLAPVFSVGRGRSRRREHQRQHDQPRAHLFTSAPDTLREPSPMEGAVSHNSLGPKLRGQVTSARTPL